MDEQMKNILDLNLHPALCVEDGRICHVNPAAAQYLLQPDTPIEPLLLSGSQEYADFAQGCLYVTLQLGAQPLGASVTRVGKQDIFMLEQPDNLAELRAMALAAKELREPLAGILTAKDRLIPDPEAADPETREQAAQLNRRLFQMMRMVSNMSDAFRYSHPGSGRMEYVQAAELFREIFDRAGLLLDAAGLKLEYIGLSEAVYTLADPERLERAVYNLLSNAAKFAPKGGRIQAKLSRKGGRLYLSVSDEGPGLSGSARSALYTHFQREPGLEDLRNGIGLGMVLVRTTAASHGGAVLVDQPEGTGNRTTMTIELRQSKETELRSPALRIDYAGEWDHGLLELSDCLPAVLYENI